MGTYTPDEMLMPTGLDSLGLRYSMERLPKESLADYRRRLLLEVRDPSDPSEVSTFRNINRKVGEFDKPVFDVTLVLDSAGEPVAADPYIEITSNFLRAYHDYSLGEAGLSVEVDFSIHEFQVQVLVQFIGNAYFQFSFGDEYSPYLKSKNLRQETTAEWRNGRALRESYMNALPDSHIDQIMFTNDVVFQEEKSTRAAVTADGDYFVDRLNGVIISHNVQSGNCFYSYRQFPFTVYSQTVNVSFLNDKDIDTTLKDALVSDVTGEEEPSSLNPRGAELLNKVLVAHPLGWGK